MQKRITSSSSYRSLIPGSDRHLDEDLDVDFRRVYLDCSPGAAKLIQTERKANPLAGTDLSAPSTLVTGFGVDYKYSR